MESQQTLKLSGVFMQTNDQYLGTDTKIQSTLSLKRRISDVLGNKVINNDQKRIKIY